MTRLNLSICGRLDQDTSILRKLLDEFQATSPGAIQVEVNSLPWESYRQELTSRVIYQHTGDVSQAGAPVASDIMAMNALRSFTPQEIADMGGIEAFAPVAWQSTQQISDQQVWSIPWQADPFVSLYWRDLLEEAGVEPESAYRTPDNLVEACGRLQAGGVARPWGITAGHKHSALHQATSWVWANGGDFISPDGKKAIFLEPAGLQGLKAYFSMIRYMAPECLRADYQVNQELFISRQTAMMVGNGETAKSVMMRLSAEMRPRLGVALLFGVPLVGGSSLVVWANSRNDKAAVGLVRFLVGHDAQAAYPISLDHLPIRVDVLNEPPYTTDPILMGLAEGLRRGRVFPITKLSGLLEEHLGNALVNTWSQLAATPDADLEALIVNNLAPIVQHYNNWMV